MTKERMWLTADIGIILISIVSILAISKYMNLESYISLIPRLIVYAVWFYITTGILSRWYYSGLRPPSKSKME